jgi:hypothetical protein
VVAKQRSLGCVFGLLLGLVLVLALCGCPGWTGVPVLTVTNARNIISTTPEFNRSFASPVVITLEMGRNSMQGTCLASVAFRVNRTSDTVNGMAFFQYWEHEWHLVSLSYGAPPNVTVIQ